jgi:hypothetical protein
MKTRLIFLVLLIICISCGNSNNPVSDAQKEKIQGEVKEVVNAVNKALEEVNWDMANEPCLDSPDFVYLYNGKAYNYKEFMDLKPAFNSRLNQKCTIISEKFAVLDNFTVLFTMNCTWLTNYKDGHSIFVDPAVTQVLFKRIDNRWRTLNIVESGVEQSVKNTEFPNPLNQVELMKQFAGSWKAEIGTDTIVYTDGKSFGIGSNAESSFRVVTKGKTIFEGKAVTGYDKNIDKFISAEITKAKDISVYTYHFTTDKKYEILPYDFSNPSKTSWKVEAEFKSPDIFVETTIENGKPPKTITFTRVK